MTEPWHLVLFWGIVVGLGTGSMATVLAATVTNRWFVRRRGLVMGVLTAASATGQLVFLPFMAWLASRHGWQAVSIRAVTVQACERLVAAVRSRGQETTAAELDWRLWTLGQALPGDAEPYHRTVTVFC